MQRLVMIVAATLALYLTHDLVEIAYVSGGNQKVQTRRKSRSTPKRRVDYSRFSHGTHVTKQSLGCDSCHKFPTANWKEVRKGDSAFPDVAEFPEHQTCLNCHRPQFFARERPAPAICANCHVNATPRNTARFLFDSLGDISDSSKSRRDNLTEFVINFPHDKHVDIVEARLVPTQRQSFVAVSWPQPRQSAQTSEAKSCPVCHQTYLPQGDSDDEYVTKPPETLGDNFWLKKGTFKTAPNSHTVCFTCHNAEVEIPPLPADCGTCHKLQSSQPSVKADFDKKLADTIGVKDTTISTTWSNRISSGTFRHEGGEHPNISCAKCHNTTTMKPGDRKSSTVPVASCGGAEGCHVTPTTDDGGILNFETDQRKANTSFVCTKCHITFGREVLPETHVKALQALKKN